MNKTVRQFVFPLVAALIWGAAFLVQGSVTEKLGAFTLNALRSFIAFVCLFALSIFVDKSKMKKGAEFGKPDAKVLIFGGLICGALIFVASNFQQAAIEGNVDGSVTEGVVAFITAFYMVLVPVLGIFMGKKTGLNVWLAVVFAIVGLYFICVNGAFSFNKYILFAILNAVAYAFHIIAIDRYAQKIHPIKLSCLQFFVSFVLSAICAVIFDKISLSAIVDCIVPILYIGILSSTLAFTLQIAAQRGGNPTVVSILMCTESVFALLIQTIIGLIYPEKAVYLTVTQYIGCALMFLGVVVSRIDIAKIVSDIKGRGR